MPLRCPTHRPSRATEVPTALGRLRGVAGAAAVTADPASPVMDLADAAVCLALARQTSVAQSCFAHR
ncbi:hypothetical protein ABZT06_13455 [Streptomyces sp. NPDC005483]|uniref:hypothetical protein n=1 Tax=Streptomyces sp. NPDC005483 TaxID=3154882 RepID=UPI0033BC9AED